MTIPSDTSADVAAMQLELLRQMSPQERLQQVFQLSAEVIQASKRAIARVHPEFSPLEVDQFFIELHHGKELADAVRAYQKQRSHG